MRKQEQDRFIGLWKHPVGGWEIKYQQDGKKRSEYRKSQDEAKLRAEYWKALLEMPQDDPEDGEEHTVHYWERILRQFAELILADPENKQLADTGRALAATATAALRTAKYVPAPTRTTSPDSAPIQADISTLTTEQLSKLIKA